MTMLEDSVRIDALGRHAPAVAKSDAGIEARRPRAKEQGDGDGL
jgi:hypothetical protein